MADYDVLDVLGALSSGVAIIDHSRCVRATNPELQRILGARSGESILAAGERFARVGEVLGFPEETTLDLEIAVAALLRGDRDHLHLEIELLSAEPARAYVIDGARIPSAGVPSALLELRDVSQQAAQRRSLDEELTLLQALLDAIPSPMFYKDDEGIYLGCNRAYEAFVGQPRERVVGTTVHDVASESVAKVVHAAELALMQGRGVQMLERRVRFADGSVHDVVLHKAAVTLLDGTLVGLVCVMFDITERKQSESALAQREDELRQQNAAVDADEVLTERC